MRHKWGLIPYERNSPYTSVFPTETLCVEVLEIAQHELGEQHCHTVRSRASLELIHARQRRLKEAKELQVSGVNNERKRPRDDADNENLDGGNINKKARK